MPDRPAGRGHELKSPPVAEYAKLHRLPLYQVENINREEKILKELEEKKIDFICPRLCSIPGKPYSQYARFGMFQYSYFNST